MEENDIVEVDGKKYQLKSGGSCALCCAMNWQLISDLPELCRKLPGCVINEGLGRPIFFDGYYIEYEE